MFDKINLEEAIDLDKIKDVVEKIYNQEHPYYSITLNIKSLKLYNNAPDANLYFTWNPDGTTSVKLINKPT